MNARPLILGLLLIGASSAAVAAAPACQPVLEQAWIRAAPPGAGMLAGYAVLRNPCPRAIAVKGVVSKDFGMAMIHETVVDGGISRMRHVDLLRVPARGELRFAPGARHLMLMQPRRDAKPGDKRRLSLQLADGRQVGADFVVRKDPPN